jgi:hypothetical protein
MDIDRSIDRVRAVHGALLRCLRYNKRTLALLALGCFIVEIRRELCCGAEILVFNKSVCIGKKESKNEFAEEFLRKRKTTLKSSFLIKKNFLRKKPVLEGKT